MHRVLMLLAVAVCVQAGTIQGVVLEQASGRPLARTVVRLDPVPGVGKALQDSQIGLSKSWTDDVITARIAVLALFAGSGIGNKSRRAEILGNQIAV